MGFSIERSADISTIRIIDTLVESDRLELRSAILGELAAGVQTLRFDFGNAGYIDGAGLGLLVSISRLARDHAVEIRLASLHDDLRTLFTLTKLDSLFTMERTDDDESAARATAPAALPTAPPTRPSGPPRGAAEDERPRA